LPKKTKDYPWVKFPPEGIQDALRVFQQQGPGDLISTTYNVHVSNVERWELESENEFNAEYRRNIEHATFVHHARAGYLSVVWWRHIPNVSTVSVELATRDQVEAVFEVFERWTNAGRIEPPPPPPAPQPVIFIGHGHSDDWKTLRDQLRDHHGLDVRAFESEPRFGQSITQILDEELSLASLAILVHTAEDEQRDGQTRARQNVVHETGLFQGRLGFDRALIVREEGCEEFSNIAGVQEIRFAPGHAREAVGEIVAMVKHAG